MPLSCGAFPSSGALFLLGIVIASVIFTVFQSRLLGDGDTLQGGSLGRRIDNTHKRWLFYYTDWKYRRNFQRSLSLKVPFCGEEAFASRMFQANIPAMGNSFLCYVRPKVVDIKETRKM